MNDDQLQGRTRSTTFLGDVPGYAATNQHDWRLLAQGRIVEAILVRLFDVVGCLKPFHKRAARFGTSAVLFSAARERLRKSTFPEGSPEIQGLGKRRHHHQEGFVLPCHLPRRSDVVLHRPSRAQYRSVSVQYPPGCRT